jgi:hypothetical protein
MLRECGALTPVYHPGQLSAQPVPNVLITGIGGTRGTSASVWELQLNTWEGGPAWLHARTHPLSSARGAAWQHAATTTAVVVRHRHQLQALRQQPQAGRRGAGWARYVAGVRVGSACRQCSPCCFHVQLLIGCLAELGTRLLCDASAIAAAIFPLQCGLPAPSLHLAAEHPAQPRSAEKPGAAHGSAHRPGARRSASKATSPQAPLPAAAAQISVRSSSLCVLPRNGTDFDSAQGRNQQTRNNAQQGLGEYTTHSASDKQCAARVQKLEPTRCAGWEVRGAMHPPPPPLPKPGWVPSHARRAQAGRSA